MLRATASQLTIRNDRGTFVVDTDAVERLIMGAVDALEQQLTTPLVQAAQCLLVYREDSRTVSLQIDATTSGKRAGRA